MCKFRHQIISMVRVIESVGFQWSWFSWTIWTSSFLVFFPLILNFPFFLCSFFSIWKICSILFRCKLILQFQSQRELLYLVLLVFFFIYVFVSGENIVLCVVCVGACQAFPFRSIHLLFFSFLFCVFFNYFNLVDNKALFFVSFHLIFNFFSLSIYNCCDCYIQNLY